MRLDVFHAKVAAEKNLKDSGEWDGLSSEAKRLVDKMLLDGKRAGLTLPEEKRNELGELKKEVSQACIEFGKNYNEENVMLPLLTMKRNSNWTIFRASFLSQLRNSKVSPMMPSLDTPSEPWVRRNCTTSPSRLQISCPL